MSSLTTATPRTPASTRPSTPRQTRRSRPRIGTYLGLAVMVLLAGLPLLWMFLASFKGFDEIYSLPLRLLPKSFGVENYAAVEHTVPLGRLFLNSVITTVIGASIKILLGLMTAYAVVFMRVPLRRPVFLVVVLALLIPQQIVIIPNYAVIAGLGWLDTYQGMILPGLASAFGTFLFRQHFLTIPAAILESAELDGAGHWRRLWSFVVPVSAPTIAAVSLASVVTEWNEYIWPLLVVSRPEMMTLPVGLTLLEDNTGITNWGVLMAGTVAVTLPVLIVFFLLQRRIIAGLTAGAVTG